VPLNVPNLLTLLRMALIPAFVLVYYMPYAYAPMVATIIFTAAGVTDWLDGYLARKLGQHSPFGAFLDPVADKLMVVAALVMLLTDPDPRIHILVTKDRLLGVPIFAMAALVILGREITVSALREWMAEVGKRSRVAVSYIGKFKTVSQMVAIGFLIWREPVFGLPIFRIGEWLLYIATGLTLWSMISYLRAAWPNLMQPGKTP
jgi:CDP-diacylglycerol--glycerol-3-phosphate 3-phosphatidyltransferase